MNTKNPSNKTTMNGGDDEDRLDWDSFDDVLFEDEIVCSCVLLELESFAFRFVRFCGEFFMVRSKRVCYLSNGKYEAANLKKN
jgi:hypothetical protein